MTLTLKQQRTKLDIIKTMNSMLKTTPFDQITINVICQKAFIHHSTFYRYFADKYDLLGGVLTLICAPIREELTKGISLMTTITHIVTSNQAQFRNMTRKNKRAAIYPDLTQIIASILKKALLNTVRHPLIDRLSQTSEPDLMAFAYAGMFVGIIQKWNETPGTPRVGAFSANFKADLLALSSTL
ncbi:TetR/AcrR family transcriptional regulator [Secundilactobacillus collinoides]|uniref:HTH tetR-type domain-containing protein n=1 Tax=Secundilactobacillus collinoides DSM 20515 = JCM 1123 TaxID=1423733 RepID=A0A0R2B5Y8_SECCO|nr:TetR/AcrR family transcriptional regulator [Secundilactobacillus collinoides]KRM74830.1 hypothetical protein FC82_GL002773 [Secundilactobacillus collinoides DSM 20515 = JCM 1123]